MDHQTRLMIAVYGKNIKAAYLPFVENLFAQLKRIGFAFAVEEQYLQHLRSQGFQLNCDSYEKFEDVCHSTDVVLSLGGDGTVLEAVTQVREAQIPILGINFGRLGFLANIGKELVQPALEALDAGRYLTDRRSLLQLQSNKHLFDLNFALNEMTIQRKDNSSMITIHTYLNGELLNSYWADGLIISTPTGSTGYSLSCGGPIIFPTSANFVITPVAPHNLNVRPMIVSDDVVLSFEVEGRSKSFLCTLDSRFQTIDDQTQIAVQKAPFEACFIRFDDNSFLSALRNKLNWGVDQRN